MGRLDRSPGRRDLRIHSHDGRWGPSVGERAVGHRQLDNRGSPRQRVELDGARRAPEVHDPVGILQSLGPSDRHPEVAVHGRQRQRHQPGSGSREPAIPEQHQRGLSGCGVSEDRPAQLGGLERARQHRGVRSRCARRDCLRQLRTVRQDHLAHARRREPVLRIQPAPARNRRVRRLGGARLDAGSREPVTERHHADPDDPGAGPAVRSTLGRVRTRTGHHGRLDSRQGAQERSPSGRPDRLCRRIQRDGPLHFRKRRRLLRRGRHHPASDPGGRDGDDPGDLGHLGCDANRPAGAPGESVHSADGSHQRQHRPGESRRQPSDAGDTGGARVGRWIRRVSELPAEAVAGDLPLRQLSERYRFQPDGEGRRCHLERSAVAL